MKPLPRQDLDHVLVHTAGLWEALRGRRLFVTGGTGFFGIWLAETFLHANERLGLGAEALLLSRDPGGFLRRAPHLAGRAGLDFHEGDMGSFAFPRGGFAHVIHAATETQRKHEPLEIFERNVEGTRRVLEFARRAGAVRLLFTSSGAVYGRQPSGLALVPEDHPGAPSPTDADAAYGNAKRAAE